MNEYGNLIVGTCDGGDCDRLAVSLAYDEQTSGLIPVCRRHILAYWVESARRWQAEDEFAELQFCRRAFTKAGAQRRILRDQRAWLGGRESRAQRKIRERKSRRVVSPVRGESK